MSAVEQTTEATTTTPPPATAAGEAKKQHAPLPVVEMLYALHAGRSGSGDDKDDAVHHDGGAGNENDAAAAYGGDDLATATTQDAGEAQADEATELVYDKAQFLLVRCSDDIAMLVPREHIATLPFLPSTAADAADSEEECTFAYPSSTLNHLYAWVRHYGVTGVAASPLPRPCTYLDFQYVAVDPWDNRYYAECVVGNGGGYVTTLRAAEEYGMQGLLDFLCVALGCELRGADSASKVALLLGFSYLDEPLNDSEIANVDADYPWLADLIKPVSVK